ncbi:MAG TPA: hypothetical protein VM532_15490 [Burkholderiales bacterium]|nr:hypothetical protein [Burkholderiales bacterium]
MKGFNQDFHAAKEKLFQDVPRGVKVEGVTRLQSTGDETRYVSLDKAGSLFSSPKHLSIIFTESAPEEIGKFLKEASLDADKVCGKTLSTSLSPIVESVDVAIYNDTVAMLTLDVVISEEFGGDDWSKLDEWTTRLAFAFLGRLYKEFIYPALLAFNRYAGDAKNASVLNPSDYVVFYDMSGSESDASHARLLWVNRTLICPKGADSNGWGCRDMEGVTPINVDGALSYLSWGNNVIETTSTSRAHDLSPVWQGMYLAQYYYAVLDITGKNLTRFIGATYDKKSNRELRKLSQAMDSVINTVTIFQVKYKDLSMELQGQIKAVFRRLEREWDFEALFKAVQGKCELCKSNVERMNAYINQRNSVRVQMVLTVVAGLGFISASMGLSSYGRALLREGYRSEVVGLLDIAQRVPPATMIWIGVGLAVAVIIFVSVNRPR